MAKRSIGNERSLQTFYSYPPKVISTLSNGFVSQMTGVRLIVFEILLL